MSDKNSNAWIWALTGLGVGLAAALLITPEKGEVMRERLKKKAGEKLDGLLESVEESLEEALDNALKSEKGEGDNGKG